MNIVEKAKFVFEKYKKIATHPHKQDVFDHLINTAICAGEIAKVSGLDADRAYSMGLLHDIAKYRECFLRHGLEGYEILKEEGFDEEFSRIAITHLYILKNGENYLDNLTDLSKEEFDDEIRFVNSFEYTDYDKLLQLSDIIGMHTGCCMLEKRLVDVMIRHGANKYYPIFCKTVLDLKKYFDEKSGINVYSVIPNIIENTFYK